MSADLQFLEEWIPERMDPGTVFVLQNQGKLGHAQNPFVAVMSCPRCGTMGLITRRQLCCGEIMICGGDVCSAEYQLDGENIRFRNPSHAPARRSASSTGGTARLTAWRVHQSSGFATGRQRLTRHGAGWSLGRVTRE